MGINGGENGMFVDYDHSIMGQNTTIRRSNRWMSFSSTHTSMW